MHRMPMSRSRSRRSCFPIRFVCAFGAAGIDGVIPLDDIFENPASDLSPPPHRAQLGAHVAVVTFETRADGLWMIARNHAQLIAVGAGIAADADWPSTPTCSPPYRSVRSPTSRRHCCHG